MTEVSVSPQSRIYVKIFSHKKKYKYELRYKVVLDIPSAYFVSDDINLVVLGLVFFGIPHQQKLSYARSWKFSKLQ